MVFWCTEMAQMARKQVGKSGKQNKKDMEQVSREAADGGRTGTEHMAEICEPVPCHVTSGRSRAAKGCWSSCSNHDTILRSYDVVNTRHCAPPPASSASA